MVAEFLHIWPLYYSIVNVAILETLPMYAGLFRIPCLSFYLFIYLKRGRGSNRDPPSFGSLTKWQQWLELGWSAARSPEFSWVSHMGTGVQAIRPYPTAFPGTSAKKRVGKPVLKLVPIWSGGTAVPGLTHYFTVLVPSVLSSCFSVFKVVLMDLCASPNNTLVI